MSRRFAIPTVLALSALSLAACGASHSPKPQTSAAPSTSAQPQAPAASAIPPVANATNLSKEPLPAPGSATPPTSLERKDLVVGKGAVATPSSTVVVKYVGANYNTGKVFDGSTWQSGPATFSLSQLVPGFSRGVTGMKVGGRREIVVPPALGYGSQGGGPIAPDETLVFVVDLLAVK